MNEQDFLGLDQNLWLKTRVVHWVLFFLGCLLMIPAGLVFLYAGAAIWEGRPQLVDDRVWTAMAGSASGVFAWIALGLLFFKRTDPRWHVAAWSTVMVFALVGGLSCVYFTWSHPFMLSFVGPIFLICLVSGSYAVRNFRLARKSQGRGDRT